MARELPDGCGSPGDRLHDRAGLAQASVHDQSTATPGGSYCHNRGRRTGRDVMRVGFQGDAIGVVFGRARKGGETVLFVDGTRIGMVSFKIPRANSTGCCNSIVE